jgi:hypothetical protein
MADIAVRVEMISSLERCFVFDTSIAAVTKSRLNNSGPVVFGTGNEKKE